MKTKWIRKSIDRIEELNDKLKVDKTISRDYYSLKIEKECRKIYSLLDSIRLFNCSVFLNHDNVRLKTADEFIENYISYN
jgi:hypothetical protein